MANQRKIEIALWAIRNLAHQIGLYAESILLDLGLMQHEQRIFFSKKERGLLDRGETSD